jgi:hypothetical protein
VPSKVSREVLLLASSDWDGSHTITSDHVEGKNGNGVPVRFIRDTLISVSTAMCSAGATIHLV